MFKCAPYIKNICNSINTTWWRDGTSSLPASPLRQPWQLPSPTRSETADSEEALGGTGAQARLMPPPIREEPDGCSGGGHGHLRSRQRGISMPSLVATTTVDANGVASTEVSLSLLSPLDEEDGRRREDDEDDDDDEPSAAQSSVASAVPPPVSSASLNFPRFVAEQTASSSSSSSPVRSDLLAGVLAQRARPDSPDITRAAKRFEKAKSQLHGASLGAIPKERYRRKILKAENT